MYILNLFKKNKELSDKNRKLSEALRLKFNNNSTLNSNSVFQLPDSVSKLSSNLNLTTTVPSAGLTNLLAKFNELRGTPYKWGGESKSGIDCSAFTQQCMKAAGVNIPRTAREQFHATKNNLVSSNLELNKMKPGDMIFFTGTTKKTASGEASHVGIYIGGGKMIHSGNSTKGVGVIDLNTSYKKMQVLGVTRPAEKTFNSTLSVSKLSLSGSQSFSLFGNSDFSSSATSSVTGQGKLDFNVPKNVSVQGNLKQRYQQNKNIMLEVQRKTGIEAALLAAIAGTESNFDPNANGGPGTTVTGIFQIRPKDWSYIASKGVKYGLSQTAKPKDNAQAALWIATRFAYNRDSGYYKKMGIQNPNGLDYYMVHFLGEGGYRTLMKNLDTPLASVMPKEAKYNKTIFYENGRARTGREIKQLMLDKLKKSYVQHGIDLPFSLINANQKQMTEQKKTKAKTV